MQCTHKHCPDGTGFTYYTTKEGLSHNNVWSLFEDKWGDIWIGTEKGLNRIRKSDNKEDIELQTYLNSDGLGGLTIRKILMDQQERLWLGGVIVRVAPDTTGEKHCDDEAQEYSERWLRTAT